MGLQIFFLSRLKPSYLLDREKDLDGLWFLSRERDLSLLLSLEKDLGREKRVKIKDNPLVPTLLTNQVMSNSLAVKVGLMISF